MKTGGVYCLRCGRYNRRTAYGGECGVCGAELKKPAVKRAGDDMVYAEILHPLGFTALVEKGARGGGALSKLMAALMAVPVFCAERVPLRGRKLRPAFKTRMPRFRPARLAESSLVDRKQLDEVTASLRAVGFVPIMDRINEGAAPERPERLFANKEKRLYAVASFSKHTRRPAIRTMFIPASGEGAAVVSNAEKESLVDPGIDYTFLPGAAPKRLVEHAEKKIDLHKTPAKALSVKNAVLELADSHERIFDRAKKNGLIVKVRPATSGPPSVEPEQPAFCANHGDTTAVSECGVCGKPVCERCRVHYGGRERCPACMPEDTVAEETPLDFSAALKPAGFGLRAAVRLVEMAALVWLIAALFPHESSAGSKIAYQLLAVVGFIAYFHVPVARWGATPGQWIVGLTVIDAQGEPLSSSSVLVRTGYFLLTIVTILPALGYLAAARGPHKRGWHDHLSGAVVVTSQSGLKNGLGAVALAGLVAFAWLNAASFQITAVEVFGRAFKPVAGAGAVRLEMVWEREYAGRPAIAAVAGDAVAAVDRGNVTSFSLGSGALIWTAPVGNVQALYSDLYSNLYFAIHADEDGRTLVSILSKLDGAVGWSVELASSPAFPPIFDKNMMYVATEDAITGVQRRGQIAWVREITAVSPPVAYSKHILVAVDDGERYGTAILETRRGTERAFFTGYAPAAPAGGNGYLLTGENGTALIDLAYVTERWSIPETLTFMEEGTSGAILFARERAVAKENGETAVTYPEGCIFAGGFERTAILSCPGEGVFRVVDGASGLTAATHRGPSFDRVKLLSEKDGAYRTLVSKAGTGSKQRLWILTMDSAFGSATFDSVGAFDAAPVVRYLPDDGAFFIATAQTFGVYKAP